MKTAFFSLDHAGVFTWVSDNVEGVSGWPKQEMIARSFTEFMLQEDLPIIMESRKRREPGRVAEYFTHILTSLLCQK